VHSRTFKLFHRAILDRHQITCVQGNCHREICPHVLGHTDGREVALVYQFAGESTSSLPPGGQIAMLLSGRRKRGRGTRRTVAQRGASSAKVRGHLYVDVNTAVPNKPGRRLRLVK
jgi:uncharacterized protein